MINNSCQPPTLGSLAMWHPWRALRGMPDVLLTMHADMPTRMRAGTDGQEIVMSDRLLQRERRSSLTHELEHIQRGHTSCRGARDETEVRQAAARQLICIDALASALAWTQNIDELAEELWVDTITVRTRIEHLHPSERGYLKRKLKHLEESA